MGMSSGQEEVLSVLMMVTMQVPAVCRRGLSGSCNAAKRADLT